MLATILYSPLFREYASGLNSKISPSIILTFPFSENLVFNWSMSRPSFSTAITSFAAEASFLVRLPVPGPTSKIISSFLISAATIILFRTPWFTKKFWPRDFFGIIFLGFLVVYFFFIIIVNAAGGIFYGVLWHLPDKARWQIPLS